MLSPFEPKIILAVLVVFSRICTAQLAPPPAPEVPPAADWTDWLGNPGSARLRARLRDVSQYAAQHTAAVEAEVENIWLNPPAAASSSGIQQGVLRYQLDHCPPVVTTDTRLRFEQLSAGVHTITVAVLGFDNRLVTPYARLRLKVP